jgi:hypothetical protein
MRTRIAVAVEAPAHRERLRLPGERHSIHSAVTLHAPHPFGDMCPVVEVDEFRQVMHPLPTERFVVFPAFADRRKGLGPDPDLLVAVHTRLGRRHSRKG